MESLRSLTRPLPRAVGLSRRTLCTLALRQSPPAQAVVPCGRVIQLLGQRRAASLCGPHGLRVTGTLLPALQLGRGSRGKLGSRRLLLSALAPGPLLNPTPRCSVGSHSLCAEIYFFQSMYPLPLQAFMPVPSCCGKRVGWAHAQRRDRGL